MGSIHVPKWGEKHVSTLKKHASSDNRDLKRTFVAVQT